MKTAIIIDIDGTVALKNDRSPYNWANVAEDTVNTPIEQLVKLVIKSKIVDKILFVSGRSDVCREETMNWLIDKGFVFHRLLMRKNGDNRKDTVVKYEIYNEYIKDKYKVKWVFDDRASVCKMWRKLGLTVLQVAEGDF